MRRFALALMMGILAAPMVEAQDTVPDRRFVVSRDMDFAGSDLQSLFDTTLDACQRACLNTEGCRAFTFNTRNNSCFPKSGVTNTSPYDGAISARLVEADPAVLERGRARFGDLTFLRPADFAQARNEAEALAVRHGGGKYTVEQLLDAAETLFAAQGYEGTSLRQIASQTGIKEPGLYNYFEGKQALYEAVLYRALNPMAEAMTFGMTQGVSPDKFIEVISKCAGTSWMLETNTYCWRRRCSTSTAATEDASSATISRTCWAGSSRATEPGENAIESTNVTRMPVAVRSTSTPSPRPFS